MSSKTKSSLSETRSKPSPATPGVSKLSREVVKSDPKPPSPLQSGRLSLNRSLQSVSSKPAINRSLKVATPPEKPQRRVMKGSELQDQLTLVQEDLKKAKEQIALLEKGKVQAIDQLKQAHKVADETNEKLKEALLAQKQAEENSEIEKFRAVEMEQAGIEAAQKKEEEWQKELEALRNQHASDVSALLSTTQELQKAKEELAMITDVKNQALSHADDATRIAEIHAEKVEILSADLARLKALLDSKNQTNADESNKMLLKLRKEMDSLSQELKKAKSFEEKLLEREASIEQLNVKLEATKMAESYARNLVEEWQSKVEELDKRMEQAGKLERSASESLSLAMTQLEEKNNLLHDAETEIASLKEKVGLLEMTIGRQKGDLEESERWFILTKEEVSCKEKEIESLNAELETLKQEKAQALDNDKFAASSVQSLTKEKNKLINELDNSRLEEEKSKKAMEGLASALHEVSVEAREAKEKLLSLQAERESYDSQMDDLRLILQKTNERYETMLDDAKHEIDILINVVEESKNMYQKSKAEWEQKEQNLASTSKKCEEQNCSLEKEIDRLINLLKHTEEEACTMREEETYLKYSLKEVEAEVASLQQALGESNAESLKLKESLLEKQNKLQYVFQQNEALRAKEAVALNKIEELSKLLEEAANEKQPVENMELTDSKKDHNLLPKVVDFSEENGHVREDKPELDLPEQQHEGSVMNSSQEESNSMRNEIIGAKIENVNGKLEEGESKEQENDLVEVEFKKWESGEIGKKEFSPEREMEQESFEEEVDSKAEDGEGCNEITGLSSSENVDWSTSPSKQQNHKKKKPLLQKFGSLLKKKGTSNQN